MKRSRWKSGLLVLAGLIVLAGCGGGNGGSGGSAGGAGGGSGGAGAGAGSSSSGAGGSSGSAKPITLEFWGTPLVTNVEGVDSPEHGDYERAMVAKFEAENPGITIKYQLIGAAEIEQTLTVALTGDNQPDIVFDALGKRLIKYVNSGKVEEISDFYDTGKFHPSMIEAVKIDGKLYGVPIWDHPEIVFLNKTIFREKGLEALVPEDRDWTLDELHDALRQVTGGGVYGTAFYALNEQGDEMMLQRFINMGGMQWNEEQTEVVMNQYPEAVEWIETMKEMIEQGIAAPGAATTQAIDALEMFKQGKLAVLPWGTGAYNAIESGKKDGSANPDIELYGIKPPYREGLTPKLTNVGTTGLAVFRQDDPEKREAVKKFVQFFTTSDNIRAMSKAGGYLPAHTESGYEADHPDLNAVLKEISGLEMASLGYKSKAYAGVRPLWFPELQAALTGRKTAQQAVDDFTSKANEMIRQIENSK